VNGSESDPLISYLYLYSLVLVCMLYVVLYVSSVCMVSSTLSICYTLFEFHLYDINTCTSTEM